MNQGTVRDCLSFAGYCMALGCATFLCARGMLPVHVVAVLLGVAVPSAWNLPRASNIDRTEAPAAAPAAAPALPAAKERAP